jgi:hypothetical protein
MRYTVTGQHFPAVVRDHSDLLLAGLVLGADGKPISARQCEVVRLRLSQHPDERAAVLGKGGTLAFERFSAADCLFSVPITDDRRFAGTQLCECGYNLLIALDGKRCRDPKKWFRAEATFLPRVSPNILVPWVFRGAS